MAGFVPNVDPMFLIQRKGTKEDPYLPLKEDKIVYKTAEKYSVTLSEIPNFQNKVKVKGLDGKYLTEIFDFNATLTASQYYVDYTSGIVYFHSSNENKQFNFEYLGVGNINFPSSRIVMQGGTKTLEGLAKDLENSKTNWLTPPLPNLAAVKSTYPTPKIGDTISTTDQGIVYRYESTGWKATQQVSDNAVTDLQIKSTNLQSKTNELTEKTANNEEQINLRVVQSSLIGTFSKKLNTGNPVSICLYGTSILYGVDSSSSDKRPALPGTTDNGTAFTESRASITPTEALQTFFNELYGNVTITQKAFPGDGTKLGWEHWNASGADLVIFDYGINDAIRAGTGYAGDLNTYINYYRLLIERELKNGTAVIILTPTRQRLTSNDKTRETVDSFSNAAKALASDYNLPVIDGSELLNNYNRDIYSDYTHFTGAGYRIFAARLAAVLLGKTVNRPYRVNSGSTMLVTPQGSSVAVKNGSWINSSGSPTPGEVVNNQGLSYKIDNTGSLVWSFYAEQDALVAIPNLQVQDPSIPFTVQVELDFGIEQAQWANIWEFKDSGGVEPSYREPSTLTLVPNDFKGYTNLVYGKYIIEDTSQPVMKITNKGWHTVRIKFDSTSSNALLINNLTFMSLDDYKNRVYQKIKLSYLVGSPINSGEELHLLVFNSGRVQLTGSVKNAEISNTVPFAQFDSRHAPRNLYTTFICGVSNTTGANQAIVTVKRTGEIYLLSSSSSSNAAILDGCSWHVDRYL